MGKKIRKTVTETPASVWLKGFLAAVIGGAVTGAGEAVRSAHETGGMPSFEHVGISAAMGALLLAGGYLSKSPLTPPK